MGPVDQKTILITGATGFIGQRLVSMARQRGHRVRVIVRNRDKMPSSWHEDAKLEVVLGDLAAAASFEVVVQAVEGTDVVIHAAGALRGDDADHEIATHLPLRAILAAFREVRSGGSSLVLASSFSVYGIAQQIPGTLVTEETPTEAMPQSRDAYCRAKLAAEEHARSVCEDLGVCLSIVRPGVVYGSGDLWNAHLGVRIGQVGILLSKLGEVPLCHVSHCADVLLRAAEKHVEPAAAGQASPPCWVYNAVDSQLPSRMDYALKLKDAGRLSRVVDLTWVPLRGVARLLRGLGGRLSLPGLLRPETLAYRLQPMRFSNAKIRRELDWQQEVRLDELLMTAGKSPTAEARQ